MIFRDSFQASNTYCSRRLHNLPKTDILRVVLHVKQSWISLILGYVVCRLVIIIIVIIIIIMRHHLRGVDSVVPGVKRYLYR